jgi:hypothetical protein
MRLRVGLYTWLTVAVMGIIVAPALGTTWTVKSTPLPSGGTEGTLRGISCITNFCAAVGDFWNPTVKKWGASGDELKEAGTWAEAKVTSNWGTEGKNADLRGVACWGKAAKPSCRAAGTYGESGKGYSAIEVRLESGLWEPKASPNPPPAEGKTIEYRGISCLSAGAFCMAAGQFIATPLFEGEKESTFAAEWNTEAWVRLFPVLNPGNRSHGHFTGVSCVEPSEAEYDCIAAGGWGREQLSGGEVIQAGSESWNNEAKTWTAIEAPEPNTAENADFYAISCKSTTSCLAVGNWKERETGRTRILAETWNGTKWTLSLESGPEGASEGTLRGVSCTSAEDCEAVGDYFTGGKEVPLAYRWKAKKWELQTTELPTGATSSALEAVSCSAAEVCEAVGTKSTSTATFLPFGEAF